MKRAFLQDNQGNRFKLSKNNTIGRDSGNDISIVSPELSRCHACIFRKNNQWFIKDTGSTNGTQVDHVRLNSTDDYPLTSQSQIIFGKNQCYVFLEENTEDTGSFERSNGEGEISPSRVTKIMTTCFLLGALTTGSILAVKTYSGSNTPTLSNSSLSTLNSSSLFMSPLNGATLTGTFQIVLNSKVLEEVADPETIGSVWYQLDGVDIASSVAFPYPVFVACETLPLKVTNLTSGTHILSAVVQLKNGTRIPLNGQLVCSLQLDDKKTSGPDPSFSSSVINSQEDPNFSSLVDVENIQLLSEKLSAQLTGKNRYFVDRELAVQIDRQLRIFGKFPLAPGSQRRIIAKAFSDRGLSSLLGVVLAASTIYPQNEWGSTRQAWDVEPSILISYGVPENATIDQVHQAAAKYAKELFTSYQSEDFLYAIACWGLPISEVGKFSAQLEAYDPDQLERKNFWKLTQMGWGPPSARDKVIRFYAVGIIGEFPEVLNQSEPPVSTGL